MSARLPATARLNSPVASAASAHAPSSAIDYPNSKLSRGFLQDGFRDPGGRFAVEKEFTLHVLFVCTGNICRSPIADRLAAAYGARSQLPDFTSSSAGTHAVIAHPIHPEAAHVLEKLGGDASRFAARQITRRIASDADLVITMTKAHRDSVLTLAPRLLRRTFTLVEASRLAADFDARSVADLPDLRPRLAAHQVFDVTDPLGQSADTFAAVGSQIADLLPPILELCRIG
jgi:protein-tyrosine phosphatase